MHLIQKQHILLYSILSFLVVFYVVAFVLRPSFLYNTDGSIKSFGLGYKYKTIIPFWLLTISIAIIAYLSIFYLSSVNIVEI